MSLVLPQVTEVLRGLWQGRWVGLAVAWLAGLAGAAYIFLTPDRYEATARVYVDTQSVLKPLMAGLSVQPNVEQEVAILSRTLISRPNLQKLVRMTDMDLRVRTAEERERLIDALMRSVYIRSVGRDNLYTIGYTDPDQQQAHRVVQSLLSIFVESGLAAKSNDTGQAKRFLEEQIKGYEQRLAEAENRVKEFKLKNMDMQAPAGTDFFSNLAAVSESLRQARLQLQEATRSRETLRQQAADEDSRPPNLLAQGPAGAAEIATPEFDARLQALTKNLDEMLLRYTDNHPDVLNTRRFIKEVEAQRDTERKRLAQEAATRARAAAPGGNVYPQLKMALAESEAQVAALTARVAEVEQRYADLRDKARSVPEREAQFAQLNREYAVHKQNYETLVQRREAATMSGEVEAATGVADFRVIDPPRVSPNPVAPNRQLLVPLVLLAALGAGIGAAYLFSLLHPTIHDGRTLKRVGGRPVLGAVSLMPSAAVRLQRRRRRLWFFGGLGGLAAAYATVIVAVFARAMLPF